MKELKKIMAGVLAVSICASAAAPVYADSDVSTLILATSADENDAVDISLKIEETVDSKVFDEEEKDTDEEIAEELIITDEEEPIEEESIEEETIEEFGETSETIEIPDLTENFAVAGKLTETITYYVSEDGNAVIKGYGRMEGTEYNSALAAFKKALITYKTEKLYICNSTVETEDGNGNKVAEEKPITSVGEGLLNGITKNSITTVVLPDTISRIEKNAFYGCAALTEIDIPDGTKYIGNAAFRGCSSLKEITVPDSVTKIENDAFYGCSALEKAVIGSGIKTALDSTNEAFAETENVTGLRIFGYCSALKDLTIPALNETLGSICFYNTCNSAIETIKLTGDATAIPDNSCYNFKKLKSVTIPDTVEVIGNNAFAYCSALEEVNMPSKLATIGDYAFREAKITSAVLPDGVTSIGSGAFYSCSEMTEINIPDGTKSIGASAFRGCLSLKEITVPDSVTKIGNDAFYGCSALEKAVIGSGIKTALDSTNEAFSETENVTGLRIFGYCSALKDLTIPVLNETLVSICFYNTCSSAIETIKLTGDATAIPDNSCYYFKKLKSVTIPDTVEVIGNSAFAYCSALEEVNMPSKLTTIGDYAFREAKITSPVLPECLNTIGTGAFYYCSEITEIVVPDSVTKIGNDAFYGCSALEKAVIGSGIKTALDSTNEAFAETENVTGLRIFGYCSALKDLTIPVLNETLGSICFYNTCNSAIETIKFTGEEAEIPENCCYYFRKLKTVTIPTTVKTVDKAAFYYCDGLETVYYDGTDEDWAAIDIKEKNDPLINAARMHSPQIEFTYGDIDNNGVVELTDLTYLSLYLMKVTEFDEVQMLAADVDGNGIIDIADLARLKQYICHDENVKELGPKE